MAKGVPRRKKGESWVAYHDRLADLVVAAEEVGDRDLSARLQRKAGDVAREHESVAERERKTKGRGPGTYPWYVCVQDQMGKGGSEARANAICGRIRGDSRKRYPEYWSRREGYGGEPRAGNPAGATMAAAVLGYTAQSVAQHVATQTVAHALINPAGGEPFVALGLDGGPRCDGARDNVVVLDRQGAVLEVVPIQSQGDLVRIDERFPDLPMIGPLHVLPSQVREMRKAATAPVVEVRRRSR